MNPDITLSDEDGSPPRPDWEGVSRYHAMAEGYLLGLLDSNHVSVEHHDAVRQYLHTLAIARLKVIKPKARRQW
jgi:hypothetical protein